MPLNKDRILSGALATAAVGLGTLMYDGYKYVRLPNPLTVGTTLTPAQINDEYKGWTENSTPNLRRSVARSLLNDTYSPALFAGKNSSALSHIRTVVELTSQKIDPSRVERFEGKFLDTEVGTFLRNDIEGDEAIAYLQTGLRDSVQGWGNRAERTLSLKRQSITPEEAKQYVAAGVQYTSDAVELKRGNVDPERTKRLTDLVLNTSVLDAHEVRTLCLVADTHLTEDEIRQYRDIVRPTSKTELVNAIESVGNLHNMGINVTPETLAPFFADTSLRDRDKGDGGLRWAGTYLMSNVSADTARQYPARFTSDGIVSLVKEKMSAEEAREYNGRFSVAEIINLRDKRIPGSKANQYDSHFSAREVTELVQQGITSEVANPYGALKEAFHIDLTPQQIKYFQAQEMPFSRVQEMLIMAEFARQSVENSKKK